LTIAGLDFTLVKVESLVAEVFILAADAVVAGIATLLVGAFTPDALAACSRT
jgi:hypothetical protein